MDERDSTLDTMGEKRDNWKKWTKREMNERTQQWRENETDERTQQ